MESATRIASSFKRQISSQQNKAKQHLTKQTKNPHKYPSSVSSPLKNKQPNKQKNTKKTNKHKSNLGKHGPTAEHGRALVTEDTEKANVLYVFFASVSPHNTSLQESQASEIREKVWSKEDLVCRERSA